MRTQALESGHPVVQGFRPPRWYPEDVGAIDEGLDAKLLGIQFGDADVTNAGERKPEGLAPKAPNAVQIRRNQAGDPLEPPAAPLPQLPFGERGLSRAACSCCCHVALGYMYSFRRVLRQREGGIQLPERVV